MPGEVCHQDKGTDIACLSWHRHFVSNKGHRVFFLDRFSEGSSPDRTSNLRTVCKGCIVGGLQPMPTGLGPESVMRVRDVQPRLAAR